MCEYLSNIQALACASAYRNLAKTDSSAYKSRLIHRTKVNEFFSRQETHVKSARDSREPVMPGMAPCLGTVPVTDEHQNKMHEAVTLSFTDLAQLRTWIIFLFFVVGKHVVISRYRLDEKLGIWAA